MKKKLLFVIPNLGAGGAEKSLVNLLNTIDQNLYEVDLFLFSSTGLFINQLPEFVKIVPRNKTLEIFQKPLLKSIFGFLKNGNFSLAVSRLRFAQMQRLLSNKSIAEQHSWKYISKTIKQLPNHYDAAIGFLEKSSIYFVVDKVKASNKMGFVHTYYSKLNADHQFDEQYFGSLNHIIGVSSECAADLLTNFPQFSNKIKIIPNIVSGKLVKNLSDMALETLPEKSIISIGRLVTVKGFDLAIEAAKILKEKCIDIHWYIIGDGPERKNLENLISQYQLEDTVHLLGLKQNPYCFIKSAKVFVQSSRYEGKSIAVDEAKILAKPIVLTNFTTAKDQIQHQYNGLICEMTPSALADNILIYLQDEIFTNEVIANLKSENFGTEAVIEKFYNLI